MADIKPPVRSALQALEMVHKDHTYLSTPARLRELLEALESGARDAGYDAGYGAGYAVGRDVERQDDD